LHSAEQFKHFDEKLKKLILSQNSKLQYDKRPDLTRGLKVDIEPSMLIKKAKPIIVEVR
jgi:hypothetical protein